MHRENARSPLSAFQNAIFRAPLTLNELLPDSFDTMNGPGGDGFAVGPYGICDRVAQEVGADPRDQRRHIQASRKS